MYFLNGDRIYIKPQNSCAGFDNQLLDCLFQLKNFNASKKIFKLNFFVDTTSEEDYQNLSAKLEKQVAEKFPSPVVVCLIAQPPLTCRVLVEAFYYDSTLWQAGLIHDKNGTAILFKRKKTEVLIGNVQSNGINTCRKNAEIAFSALEGLLQQAALPVDSVIRQWNYIENIIGMDNGRQCYQEFNNVRSTFYSGHFGQTGYPAATGIGMNRGGVLIEFVAVKSRDAVSIPLDNPEQVAAHDYSKKVLVADKPEEKSTPKFERARYFELFEKKMVFISGTASIRGEKTVAIGDPVEQTRVTINNIQQLYSPEQLLKIPGNLLQPQYGHARVYIKNRKDFAAVKRTFKKYYGNLPVVYIIADICRDDLLVEIEGKVILE
jgi:hypothetical protein